MSLRASTFSIVIAIASSTAACSSESIVLATLPAEDSGVVAAPRCSITDPCPVGSFCAKSTCNDVAGTCELVPQFCADESETPVCGCDHLTYFNDCQRTLAGISASSPNPCPLEVAIPCGGPDDAMCPDYAKCARLSGIGPQRCPKGEDTPGTCWVLPARCPTMTTTEDALDSCDGTIKCVDRCNAIRTQKAFGGSMSCM